ncbi:MAG TPA: prepilin-type N-terminal cleavage/methylation domain-containing protein [Dongiaceae bacterium]|nr:prepilin-type N-terminal cleavage/methylation domain-containing protein [Dongiaceae bacterium]
MKTSAQDSSRKMPRARAARGFSLIELLIVVAIILIIAAIAIPNLLKAKMAANESSAVESLRTIDTGETTYSAACPDVGYSSTLKELNAGATCLSGKNIIDNILGASDPSTKSGYTFNYAASQSGGLYTAYTITGLPGVIGVTGQRGFYSDQTDVVRYSMDGSAPSNLSSAIQ